MTDKRKIANINKNSSYIATIKRIKFYFYFFKTYFSISMAIRNLLRNGVKFLHHNNNVLIGVRSLSRCPIDDSIFGLTEEHIKVCKNYQFFLYHKKYLNTSSSFKKN